MKIFLIGMPGCGKSTFGRKAAGQLEMDFIDLDTEIVNHARKSINAIFDEEGEEYFRKVESELLKSLTESHVNFIMATGGGAPCFFDNMDFMNDRGLTFYIDTDVDFLLERLSRKGINKRPLLKKIGQENLEEGLREKLNDRYPFYSKAHITLAFQQDLENRIVEIIRSRT
jgi:shikimate kinase